MSETHRRLVTVMAGYADNGEWSPVTLRWIQAVRSVSDFLVLVVDQDDLSVPAEFLNDECLCFLASMACCRFSRISWICCSLNLALFRAALFRIAACLFWAIILC